MHLTLNVGPWAIACFLDGRGADARGWIHRERRGVHSISHHVRVALVSSMPPVCVCFLIEKASRRVHHLAGDGDSKGVALHRRSSDASLPETEVIWRGRVPALST